MRPYFCAINDNKMFQNGSRLQELQYDSSPDHIWLLLVVVDSAKTLISDFLLRWNTMINNQCRIEKNEIQSKLATML